MQLFQAVLNLRAPGRERGAGFHERVRGLGVGSLVLDVLCCGDPARPQPSEALSFASALAISSASCAARQCVVMAPPCNRPRAQPETPHSLSFYLGSRNLEGVVCGAKLGTRVGERRARVHLRVSERVYLLHLRVGEVRE